MSIQTLFKRQSGTDTVKTLARRLADSQRHLPALCLLSRHTQIERTYVYGNMGFPYSLDMLLQDDLNF